MSAKLSITVPIATKVRRLLDDALEVAALAVVARVAVPLVRRRVARRRRVRWLEKRNRKLDRWEGRRRRRRQRVREERDRAAVEAATTTASP